YRIAQEAMTNAVKHGGAQSVRLHLGVAHRKLRMTIVDDGRGLPPEAERSSGMGLHIMRYRARIARGEVRVESVEPNGVRVICECPIDPSDVSAEPPSQRAHRHQALRVAAKRGPGIGGRIATRSESARAVLAHSKHRVKGEHK
ncbi:MAG TPA: ATP-binding protein, partial [Steroidobacteraceae bacterium]|nr:ATP-binding protein [Steroidobacteraceae bacterium]